MSPVNSGHLDKSDLRIAGLIIFGALGLTALLLALCGLFVLCRNSSRGLNGRSRSNNSIVREQSISIVRGEHPIAFMLPTVSLSEAGSETDPTPSDLESFGYQSTQPSPSISSLSLASLTGSNIYSSTLLSPTHSFPRSGPTNQGLSTSRPSSFPSSASTSPRPHSYPSRPVKIPGLRDHSARSSPILKNKETDDEEVYSPDQHKKGPGLPMGRVAVRLTFRAPKDELQIKVLKGENFATNYKTGTANTSVKISLLPKKLPKYTTEVVEESLNPEYNEEFTFLTNKQEIHGKVLRITVFDHDRSHKKVIGCAVLSLAEIGFHGDRELEVRESWLNLKESVGEELTELLADRLELSLRYEPEPGRLSLGVLSARILSVLDTDTEVYAKVTLFEGRRVIKAKKTRLIAVSCEVQFQEKFSILLPPNYLDGVSCIVSLCSRSRLGVKQVLGRTSVGPYAYCSGPGLQQWQTMVQHPCEEITVVHLVT